LAGPLRPNSGNKKACPARAKIRAEKRSKTIKMGSGEDWLRTLAARSERYDRLVAPVKL
jgi:hypothetical protein